MKLDHIAIVVENIREALTWYSNLFPIEVLYEDDSWGLVKVPSIGIKIAFVLKTEHPGHIGIAVDKMPDWAEKGNFHRDGSEYHYEVDPWGNALEFVRYPDEDYKEHADV